MASDKTQQAYARVNVTRAQDGAWIEFDGTRAMDKSFWTELAEALQYAYTLGVSHLVLSGGETTFSVGNSLAWLSHTTGNAIRRGERDEALSATGLHMRRVSSLLNEAPIVTFALATGNISGAGVELACVADFRVCIEPVTLSLPEPLLGVVPDLAPRELLDAVLGTQTSRKLLFASQRLSIERDVPNTFGDYFCNDAEDAKSIIARHSRFFPRGRVVPALRDPDRRAASVAEASRVNERICDPDDFRANIKLFADRDHARASDSAS